MTGRRPSTSSSNATMAFTMRPWLAPNFATVDMPAAPKQDGMRDLPTFHVSDLPVETLDQLAEQWRVDLYVKAGKPLPENRNG